MRDLREALWPGLMLLGLSIHALAQTDPPVQIADRDVSPSTITASTREVQFDLVFRIRKDMFDDLEDDETLLLDVTLNIFLNDVFAKQLKSKQEIPKQLLKSMPKGSKSLDYGMTIVWKLEGPTGGTLSFCVLYKLLKKNSTTGTETVLFTKEECFFVSSRPADTVPPTGELKVLIPTAVRQGPPGVPDIPAGVLAPDFDPIAFPFAQTPDGDLEFSALSEFTADQAFPPESATPPVNVIVFKPKTGQTSFTVQQNYPFPAFAGTFADTGSGVSSVGIVVNGIDLSGQATIADGKFFLKTFPGAALPHGINFAVLQVSDKNGNAISRKVRIEVDRVPPEIRELVPADSIQSGEMVHVEIQYDDEIFGVDPSSVGIAFTSLSTFKTEDFTSKFVRTATTASADIPLQELLAFVESDIPLSGSVFRSDGSILVRVFLRDRITNPSFKEFTFRVTEVPADIIQAINERIEAQALVKQPDDPVSTLATLNEAFARVFTLAVFGGVFYNEDTVKLITEEEFLTSPKFAALSTSDLDAAFSKFKALTREKKLEVIRRCLQNIRCVSFDPSLTTGAFQRLAVSGQERVIGTGPSAAQELYNFLISELEKDPLSAPPPNATDWSRNPGGSGASVGVANIIERRIDDEKDLVSVDDHVTRGVQIFDLTKLKSLAAVEKIELTRGLLLVSTGPTQTFNARLAIKKVPEGFDPANPLSVMIHAAKDANFSQEVGSEPEVKVTPSTGFEGIPKSQLPDKLFVGLSTSLVYPTRMIEVSSTGWGSIQSETGGYGFSVVRLAFCLRFRSLPLGGLFPSGTTLIPAIEDENAPAPKTTRKFNVIGSFVVKTGEVAPPGSVVKFEALRDGLLHKEQTVLVEEAGLAFFDFTIDFAQHKAGTVFKVFAKLVSTPEGEIASPQSLSTGDLIVVAGPAAFVHTRYGKDVETFSAQQMRDELEDAVKKGITIVADPPELCADGADILAVKAVFTDKFFNLITLPESTIDWSVDGDFVVAGDRYVTPKGEAFAHVRSGLSPEIGELTITLDDLVATRKLVSHELEVTFTRSPPAQIEIEKGNSVEVEVQVKCKKTGKPVADGTVVTWFATSGTIVAQSRTADGPAFEGVIRGGKATAVYFTETFNPYNENSPRFEKAVEEVSIGALVGETRAETLTQLVYPPDAVLQVHGTPVIIGDHTSPGSVPILKKGIASSIPFETSAQITIKGPANDVVRLDFEGNSLSKALYAMDDLPDDKIVPDSVGGHDGQATGVDLDLEDFKVGSGSYVFKGTSFVEVPIGTDLQLLKPEINLFLKLTLDGQNANVIRSGSNWAISVRPDNRLTFTVRTANKVHSVTSIQPLTKDAWHKVHAKVHDKKITLTVGGVLAEQKIPQGQNVTTSLENIFIGEALFGKIDNLDLADAAFPLLNVPESTVKLGKNGTAVITVSSTGALAGKKFFTKAILLHVSGSPTVTKPIAVATLDAYQVAGEYGENILGKAEAGASLLLSFTVVGDVIDFGKFLIDLLPGGDEPDFLSGALSAFGLVSNFFPLLKPVATVAKFAATTNKARKLASGLNRMAKTFTRAERKMKNAAQALGTTAGKFLDEVGKLDDAGMEFAEKLARNQGDVRHLAETSARVQGDYVDQARKLNQLDEVDPKAITDYARGLSLGDVDGVFKSCDACILPDAYEGHQKLVDALGDATKAKRMTDKFTKLGHEAYNKLGEDAHEVIKLLEEKFGKNIKEIREFRRMISTFYRTPRGDGPGYLSMDLRGPIAELKSLKRAKGKVKELNPTFSDGRQKPYDHILDDGTIVEIQSDVVPNFSSAVMAKLQKVMQKIKEFGEDEMPISAPPKPYRLEFTPADAKRWEKEILAHKDDVRFQKLLTELQKNNLNVEIHINQMPADPSAFILKDLPETPDKILRLSDLLK